MRELCEEAVQLLVEPLDQDRPRLVCHTCYDDRKACTFCGTRLPIEQLIPVHTSSGTGLACESCYNKSRACSRCGDHFPIEQMVAIREPGFFGYYCSECVREREEEAAQRLKLPVIAFV